MQRGRKTSLEERIEIGERGQAGQTDAQIAKVMGFSIWTVRKWRRKYQRTGRAGLASAMGRPATGALGQFPKQISQVVQQMRQEHPGWGPLTIRTELEDAPNLAGMKLPHRSRLAGSALFALPPRRAIRSQRSALRHPTGHERRLRVAARTARTARREGRAPGPARAVHAAELQPFLRLPAREDAALRREVGRRTENQPSRSSTYRRMSRLASSIGA